MPQLAHTVQECLNKMIAIGVNAIRVNMSHGSQAEKETLIRIEKQFIMKNGERPRIVADDIPRIVERSQKSKKLVMSGKRDVITEGVPVGIFWATNYLTILKV